ncbi:Uncharacterised protein [Legionella quateirensis]|uniref:Uncharacterized protein n=1 Tax=Legionella quateirensis TaxID=45072 RepID=A0A378KZN5_9GAMM|nr:hypothetical protein Lqua_2265 [Legionella quateirensis]STY19071.1 Uncharacterised protein [Legionella quateirensis]
MIKMNNDFKRINIRCFNDIYINSELFLLFVQVTVNKQKNLVRITVTATINLFSISIL